MSDAMQIHIPSMYKTLLVNRSKTSLLKLELLPHSECATKAGCDVNVPRLCPPPPSSAPSQPRSTLCTGMENTDVFDGHCYTV